MDCIEIAFDLGTTDRRKSDALRVAVYSDPVFRFPIPPNCTSAQFDIWSRGDGRLVRLPDGKLVEWSGYTIDLDNAPIELGFGIPTEALAKVWPETSGFPFAGFPSGGRTPHPPPQWYLRIVDWFRAIGERAFHAVPFSSAIIGHEVGFGALREVRQKGVPACRWQAYLVAQTNQLRWYPPTPPPARRLGSWRAALQGFSRRMRYEPDSTPR